MFHGGHIMCIFLEMMANEEPEKEDDLNLFSWKEDVVGKTHALLHKWAGRLTAGRTGFGPRPPCWPGPRTEHLSKSKILGSNSHLPSPEVPGCPSASLVICHESDTV